MNARNQAWVLGPGEARTRTPELEPESPDHRAETKEATLPDRERLLKLTDHLARELQEGIDSACEVSAAGVLCAGELISAIVESARRQVARTAETKKRIEEGTDVAEAVRVQSKSIRDFAETVIGHLNEQQRSAERALGDSQSVREAGERISSVASAARILSLNARIEAGRLGDVGKPFVVIATEMRELVADIEQTSRIIGELVQSLTRTLPDFLDMTGRLQNVAQGFNAELDRHVEQVAQAREEVQHLVRQATEAGQDEVQQVIQEANRARAALGFQDPVQQLLLKLARLAKTYADDVFEIVGEDPPVLAEPTDSDQAPHPVGDPLRKTEDEPAPGDMMLF